MSVARIVWALFSGGYDSLAAALVAPQPQRQVAPNSDVEAAVQCVAGLLVRVYGAEPSEKTAAQARRLALAALNWPSVRDAACVWGNPDCHEERHRG